MQRLGSEYSDEIARMNKKEDMFLAKKIKYLARQERIRDNFLRKDFTDLGKLQSSIYRRRGAPDLRQFETLKLYSKNTNYGNSYMPSQNRGMKGQKKKSIRYGHPGSKAENNGGQSLQFPALVSPTHPWTTIHGHEMETGNKADSINKNERQEKRTGNAPLTNRYSLESKQDSQFVCGLPRIPNAEGLRLIASMPYRPNYQRRQTIISKTAANSLFDEYRKG